MTLSINPNKINSLALRVWILFSTMLPLSPGMAFAQETALQASDTKNVQVDAGHWNQFRGPSGDGKARGADLPLEFSETKNIRWKTAIHGKGWSSPVVWGRQIWLTSGREDGSELFALCVDLDSGKIIHDLKVFDVAQPQSEWSDLNSHATPTPVVEEGRVYVHFGTYGTACLDTKTGRTLWERRDLNCDHRVRPASSPIIEGDSIFLHFDGVDAQFVVALDKRNGKTQWLTNRDVQSDLAETLRAQGVTDVEKTLKAKPNDNRKAYATPTVIAYQGRRQLISPGAEVTFSYDPANGEELWRVRHPGWGWNVACRPVFENGLVYLTTGVSRHLLAVRPSGSGDITETHIAWSTKRSTPSIPSPLIVDDLLFMVSNEGFASCLEAETGKVLWKERLRSGGEHWACPVFADGKLYFCGKRGVVSVVRAAREFQLLGENRLEASFIASPAIVEDNLILRSLTHLYCVAEGYQRSPEQVAADRHNPTPQEAKAKPVVAGKGDGDPFSFFTGQVD